MQENTENATEGAFKNPERKVIRRRRNRGGIDEDNETAEDRKNKESTSASETVVPKTGWGGAEEHKKKKKGFGLGGMFKKRNREQKVATTISADINIKDTAYDEGSDDEDFMMIPTLQENADENFQMKVADAPQYYDTKVPTMEELEHNTQLALPKHDALDLSMLKNNLSLTTSVNDPDELWSTSTFDRLLEEITVEHDEKNEQSLDEFAF